MQMETLRDLYIDELKDLWSAEKQLIKALPRMAKAATHPQLAKAFTNHLRQTEQQVARLERIFEELDESPRGKKCVGMEGLIEEGQELIKERPDPDVLDAGLIAKAQSVEHYEIAVYGTARTYARILGLERQADLLQETLDEEGETDKLLTQIAESSINLEAAIPENAEEETASRRGEREVSRQSFVEGGRAGSRGASSRGSRGRTSKSSESTAR